jgi:hypothetical protein
MALLKQTLLILVITFAMQSLLPWWTLVLPCLAVSFLMGRSGTGSFFAGFFGVGLLWLGLSLYIDWATASPLSQKIAVLFPGKSVLLLRAITVLVGGLVGGFASLSGYSVKAVR